MSHKNRFKSKNTALLLVDMTFKFGSIFACRHDKKGEFLAKKTSLKGELKGVGWASVFEAGYDTR